MLRPGGDRTRRRCRSSRCSVVEDQLDEVRIACPDIATACDQARVFAGLVRDRRGHLLADWVREAETNGPGPVRGFAGFLRQDWDAILAGMTLDYSSGVVEGHGNRLRPCPTW